MKRALLCILKLVLLHSLNLTAAPDYPDIILYNGNILTMDEEYPIAEAVAITSRWITAVGTDEDILSMQIMDTRLIDLEGRTVLPGMIEGHDHLLQGGFYENGVSGLKRATERMAANGYTTVHQMFTTEDFVYAAQELALNDELAVRMNFYLPYNTNCNDDVDTWQSFPYTEKKDTLIRIVGVKIFADGGTCGYGSSVTKPYLGYPDEYGDLFRTEGDMKSIVATVLDEGFPIAMHAIGDSAIGVGLNAFEEYFGAGGNTLRCRMEHLCVMREDLADQMAELGIAASIQYTWARARRAPYWESLYQPEVLPWVYSWRKLADRGIPIVGGNDAPYTSRTQSMQTISYLATRKNRESDTLSSWMAGEVLTVEEGIRAMTNTNAWVVFEENVKGSITSDKLADLVVLSDNPLTVDPYDVRKIEVEMTIMDGIIRYDQLGKQTNAIHDAGTFSMSADSRGYWGPERNDVGFHRNNIEQLWQGSLVVSYDENTLATATTPQEDFVTVESGWMDFKEPGPTADEEALVVYEDVTTFHPNSVRIKQHSLMWENEPYLVVEYTLLNPNDHDISDLYLGQFMAFDIAGDANDWTSYADDMAAWEANNGRGFAYMYDADQTAPYIGVAMFDTSGTYVNNALTFNAGYKIESGDEGWFSETMRNGIIETEALDPSDYSLLLSSGPYQISGQDSIQPFRIAILEGDNLEDLKDAMDQVYQQYGLLTEIDQITQRIYHFENYPNPFRESTTISFSLKEPGSISIEVYDLLGQKVSTILSGYQTAGNYQMEFYTHDLTGVLYLLTLKAGDLRLSRKMVLLK